MLQQLASFEDAVVGHYKERGYTVHRGRKVRGGSGAVYAIDLIVQAPHGNLVVSFGDDGEVEAPEVGAVRTAAKDIGATPVVASPRLTPDVRNMALRLGVVVMDQAALEEDAVTAPQSHDPTDAWAPWPGQTDGDRSPWPTGRERVPPRRDDLDASVRGQKSRFGWLESSAEEAPVHVGPRNAQKMVATDEDADAAGPARGAASPRQTARPIGGQSGAATQATTDDGSVVRVPVRHTPRPPIPDLDWRAPALYGAVTGVVGGLVFFLLVLLLL